MGVYVFLPNRISVMRANMRISIVAILLLLTTLVVAKEPFKFDSVLASDIASAYLKAYFSEYPERKPKGMNWKHTEIISAIDGNGRELVLVAYSAEIKETGAVMYLEKCADIFVPSWYRASSALSKETRESRAIENNKTADYPGGRWMPE
jgi:hypothetical protein